MKKEDLIFRFHDPNGKEITAKLFWQTILKANEKNWDEIFLHTVREQKRSEEIDDKRRRVLPCIHG